MMEPEPLPEPLEDVDGTMDGAPVGEDPADWAPIEDPPPLPWFERFLYAFYDWAQREDSWHAIRAAVFLLVCWLLRPVMWWLQLPGARVGPETRLGALLNDVITLWLPFAWARVYWYGALSRSEKLKASYPCQVCRARIADSMVRLYREGSEDQSSRIYYSELAAFQAACQDYNGLQVEGLGHGRCTRIGDVLGERWADVP